MKKVKVKLKNGKEVEGDYFEKNDEKALKNIFLGWLNINKSLKNHLCPTLTANMGTGGHNVPLVITKYGIRKLTPKECFNLQGFPTNYKLPDIPISQLYKQAGNSVCVTVIERIAKSIKKAIEQR